MQFIKKCCQCYCCSCKACQIAQCIDVWHACQAYGLCYLFCDACCWTLCAPICIECKCGDMGKAMNNCTTGCKYCIFGCALQCISPCDGCYNCIKVASLACSEGIKNYSDLTKNAQFIANKIKQSLGLQTGNQPLKSMATFQP